MQKPRKKRKRRFMPRKDRTFTDQDILRLYFHNLTTQESKNVLERLCGTGPGGDEGKKPASDLLKALRRLKTALGIMEKLSLTLLVASKLPGPQKVLFNLLYIAANSSTITVRSVFLLLPEGIS
jgi:hypothetical protein